MKPYKQLASEQRYQIYGLKQAGLDQSQIALYLGVNKSTISRELSRNKGQRGWRPKQAQSFRDANEAASMANASLHMNGLMSSGWSERTSVRNRLHIGLLWKAACRSVTKPSTATSMQTRKTAATCTSIYEARNHIASVMQAGKKGAAC